MKKNEDIRTKAQQNSIYLYEIAEVLGVSEPTFNRWLRKELSEKMKADVYAAIDIISEQRKENEND